MLVVLTSKNSNVCYLESSTFFFFVHVNYLYLFASSYLQHVHWGRHFNDSKELEALHAVWDVESKVNDKLSAMKKKMESADKWLVRKLWLDSKPTFKKRSHEKQQQFNGAQVRDKMDAAAAVLELTPSAVEKVCTSLQEGEKFINVYQKKHFDSG